MTESNLVKPSEAKVELSARSFFELGEVFHELSEKNFHGESNLVKPTYDL